MIFVTGDCHRTFMKFARQSREYFNIPSGSTVIVCGDFGLCWADDKEFKYWCDWFKQLPLTVLWVQGNHENYDMIESYQLEECYGGLVRHIVRNKVILLERGQVFDIEGYRFFTFGGASSHDIQGGILDKSSPDYDEQRKRAIRSGLPYRVKGYSWWPQELPSEVELQVGRDNLDKVGCRVDFVISHCLSTKLQTQIVGYGFDRLTDYFDELEGKLHYRHWFAGHYHADTGVDSKHTILYNRLVNIADYE